jgi:hypothetical protein
LAGNVLLNNEKFENRTGSELSPKNFSPMSSRRVRRILQEISAPYWLYVFVSHRGLISGIGEREGSQVDLPRGDHSNKLYRIDSQGVLPLGTHESDLLNLTKGPSYQIHLLIVNSIPQVYLYINFSIFDRFTDSPDESVYVN